MHVAFAQPPAAIHLRGPGRLLQRGRQPVVACVPRPPGVVAENSLAAIDKNAHTRYLVIQYMNTDTTSDIAGDSHRAQLLKGVAELALLRLLSREPQYGLEILDQLRTQARLQMASGTIYPLLHRLERAGAVKPDWRIEGDAARPRKYYAITAHGRAQLRTLAAEWRRFSDALNAFLEKG